jgi:hypothetical protein
LPDAEVAYTFDGASAVLPAPPLGRTTQPSVEVKRVRVPPSPPLSANEPPGVRLPAGTSLTTRWLTSLLPMPSIARTM